MQTAGSDAGAEPRAGFAAWWMVGVLLTFYILSFCDRIIVVLMVDDLKADLGLTDFQISLILGPAFALCYAVAGFPLGWAADRFARRWVVWGGVTVWSLSTAACGLVTSFAGLFTMRAVVGVGEASLSPAAYSLIADRFPRRLLTTALSVFTMGPKAGAAVAYGVGAAAIHFAMTMGAVSFPVVGTMKPWQLVFMMVGAPGLVLALLSFTFREPPRRQVAGEAEVSSRSEFFAFVARHKVMFVMLMVGFALMAVTSGALMNWAPAYITRRFGWTAPQYAPILAISSVLAALTLPVKGAVVDWLYGRGMHDAHLRFYTWTLGAAIPAAGFGVLLSSPIWYLVTVAVVEIVALTYVLYMSALIQMLTPNRMRGRMTGLFLFTITIIGMGAGPTLVAAVTDFGFRDPAMVGYSMAIVCVGAMSVALLLFRLSLKRIGPLLLAERSPAPDGAAAGVATADAAAAV